MAGTQQSCRSKQPAAAHRRSQFQTHHRQATPLSTDEDLTEEDAPEIWNLDRVTIDFGAGVRFARPSQTFHDRRVDESRRLDQLARRRHDSSVERCVDQHTVAVLPDEFLVVDGRSELRVRVVPLEERLVQLDDE